MIRLQCRACGQPMRVPDHLAGGWTDCEACGKEVCVPRRPVHARGYGRFECEACGEEMEMHDRMAGRRVKCLKCGEKVPVPVPVGMDDPGLSTSDYLLFGLLFLVIPAANVVVSSILYYVWKHEQPKRAAQINTLGFLIF